MSAKWFYGLDLPKVFKMSGLRAAGKQIVI